MPSLEDASPLLPITSLLVPIFGLLVKRYGNRFLARCERALGGSACRGPNGDGGSAPVASDAGESGHAPWASEPEAPPTHLLAQYAILFDQVCQLLHFRRSSQPVKASSNIWNAETSTACGSPWNTTLFVGSLKEKA